VHFIPAPSSHSDLSLPPSRPEICARIDLGKYAVWGVLQVCYLHVGFSFSFTHFFLLCYQQTTRHDDCVVIVKEVCSSSIFYMQVCGGGCSNPVLLPLNSPPLPMDSWLLWCEGLQQQQQQQQPGLSVVLVTVCGRERFVLLKFSRCCCIGYGGVVGGSGA
jgi:hypothetical protein